MNKLILLLNIILLGNLSAQIDAKTIVKKSEEQYKGIQSYAEVEMQIVRKDWTKTMVMKTWHDGSKNEQSLILVTAPAKEKGSAFLKVDRDVWNWQPKIERVIKMPPSMMSESWMGSDFSNDDIVQESSMVNDYTHHYKKDSSVAGLNCYKIELIPHEDAPVVWGKIIMYITKDTYLQMKVEFYDEDHELINTMEASNIGSIGGKQLPKTLTITPEDKEGQKTIMNYLSLDFHPQFSPDFFTTQNLKRMR